MPFNSNTYHANKNRKLAWAALDMARYHRFASRGETSDYLREHYLRMAAQNVRSARGYMTIHLAYKKICKIDREGAVEA
jgi:hypothetical protein